MAFSTQETSILPGGGPALGTAELFILCTSTGGTTGGLVTIGTPTVGLPQPGSSGLRKIIHVSQMTTTASGTTPQVAIAFDATTQRDLITLTTAANQVVSLRIVATQAGA